MGGGTHPRKRVGMNWNIDNISRKPHDGESQIPCPLQLVAGLIMAVSGIWLVGWLIWVSFGGGAS